MTKEAEDIQSFISKKLHNLLFLEEFVFSRNKFSPPASSEVEFADAVVMLGDVLLVYQIKERGVLFLTSGSKIRNSNRRWTRTFHSARSNRSKLMATGSQKTS